MSDRVEPATNPAGISDASASQSVATDGKAAPDLAANYAYWQENGAYWAAEYERRRRQDPLYGLQEIVLISTIERAAPARVLEYGCGVGRHLSYLSTVPGIEIYGVDQSPTMLAGFERWASREWIADHVRLIEPIGTIPFDDGFFDLSYTAEVLLHVRPEDLESRLKELVRVSRRAVIHLEPPQDYVLATDAHEGCWYHDLAAAYARLGVKTMRAGRPVDAQELIVADLNGGDLDFVPGPATLAHLHAVEHWMRETQQETVESTLAEPTKETSLQDAFAQWFEQPEPTQTEILQAFSELPEDFRNHVQRRKDELHWFNDRGVLSTNILSQDIVLDWEAGDCAFSIAMLLIGAKRVVAADSWMNIPSLAFEATKFPGLFVAKATIQEIKTAADQSRMNFDLVFANTVTEHLPNLVGSFRDIYNILRRNGHFFTNHDNYYQPVGSHDHGFLFYGENLEIVPQGVRCWESAEKCAVSADHRARIAGQLSWTYSPDLEKSRDPNDCEKCFYYRRSQPWSHLLYQEEFRSVFGNESFFTGTRRSTLNKVTLFQLRQFVVESGMDIVASDRVFVSNEPPESLLQAPFFFSYEDLKTCTATILAQKQS